MTTTVLLDAQLFAEAQDLLGKKFTTILGFFLDDSASMSEEIINAFSQGNAEGVAMPAHSLKSSSRQFGALQLSDLTRALELGAKKALAGEAGLVDLAPQVAALKPLVEATAAELRHAAGISAS